MGVVLPEYPQVAPPEWCELYIGLPYKMGGRGPDEYDCWGLIWLVLIERFSVAPPSYEGVVWSTKDAAGRKTCGGVIAHAAARHFDPVEPGQERPGDVVVLRIGAHPLHVGIVVAPGWMLHTAEDADCALERYDGMVWRNRVEGFHRLR